MSCTSYYPFIKDGWRQTKCTFQPLKLTSSSMLANALLRPPTLFTCGLRRSMSSSSLHQVLCLKIAWILCATLVSDPPLARLVVLKLMQLIHSWKPKYLRCVSLAERSFISLFPPPGVLMVRQRGIVNKKKTYNSHHQPLLYGFQGCKVFTEAIWYYH